MRGQARQFQPKLNRSKCEQGGDGPDDCKEQAREIGLLAVALMVLAAMRVLMPLTGVLVVAVIVLVETLMLSQVTPER